VSLPKYASSPPRARLLLLALPLAVRSMRDSSAQLPTLEIGPPDDEFFRRS